MLNELLIVERAARLSGIDMELRHPDVKNAGRKPTLHVLLNADGRVSKVQAIPSERIERTPLWKLSEGQKNSFPFVQPKTLWNADAINWWKERLSKKSTDAEKREALLSLASDDFIRTTKLGEWASGGMLEALRKRRQQLIGLENSEIAAFTATIDRFALACDTDLGGNPAKLVQELVSLLMKELTYSASSDLLAVAIALLMESGIKGGALYFDADGDYPIGLTDNHFEEPLCKILREIDLESSGRVGICSITGENGVLVTGNFSQPNLPIIQQTFIFSRNETIPSSDRYGKSAAKSIPVGYMTDIRLRAAIEALTSADRENITWRAIPCETLDKSDLLLAFVESILDTPLVEFLVKEDFSNESPEMLSNDSIAAFEKRTERLIHLVRAKVGNDVSETKVKFIVLRMVDKANRKVVYADTLTVANLYDAATTWTEGERNVPFWIILPIFKKGERQPQQMSPPHVAPLGLIAFSKQLYIRGGTKLQKVVGMSAAETLRLFLDPITSVRSKAERLLRLILVRRISLLIGVAHVQHTPQSWTRRTETIKKFDCVEALRMVTVLGVLLNKLKRTKEVYMNDTAFKLGQLLATVDIVHAGYCADVRGGAVPPSLLGNQVFAIAQATPAKALAALCRRWKPYDGWAKKATREPNRADAMIASNRKDEQQRGWDIKKALRHAREMGPLAAELALALGNCCVNDVFRAELLLGYIAGLPKAQKEDCDVEDQQENGRINQ
jgi:hypothetical protein